MVGRLSEMNLPRFPLLSDQQQVDLLEKTRNGDEEAREQLINCNLKLVFNVVKRFDNRGYDLDDLFQIGTIGLIKAIDKFDMSYGVKFSTYAVPMIVGEIRRFLRDDSPVKVSRSLKEIAGKVRIRREELSKNMGREPSINELAESLDIPKEQIVEALEAAQLPSSIYDTLYQDSGDPIFVSDQLGSTKEDENVWFDKIALKDLLMSLSEKHRKVLLMRFFQDKTQTEVAEVIGLSQVQVSRIERQALKQIRQLLADNEKR
ncbi:RNA polymerase sporulation sigma factor SigF [Metallumcola ferriviriculae]|uniref:RNA polymerase sigma factor n=1 Tax=Metallumcola ferriviriculae TaxID=3039180 RepID=A0AAU0URM0_9FIRM|nr:RNA polymerase sporulation sigma factor SigF [Desulfitibacteraceae bacterium MK1]